MEKRITTDWKHIKRSLISEGFSYTNHGRVGEFNKDDILILIDKDDPDNLSYVAYMGEEPISLHINLGHGLFYKGGLSGSVQQIPDSDAPVNFSWPVYVYLDGASHKGHRFTREYARKEMGIE